MNLLYCDTHFRYHIELTLKQELFFLLREFRAFQKYFLFFQAHLPKFYFHQIKKPVQNKKFLVPRDFQDWVPI